MTKTLTLGQIEEGRAYLLESEMDGDMVNLETWLVQHASELLDAAEERAKSAGTAQPAPVAAPACDKCGFKPATLCNDCLDNAVWEESMGEDL